MDNVFGENVKALRTKVSMTQKELAEKLGISSASVIAYEKGQKSPSIDIAKRIAEQFGVSLDSLCGMGATMAQYESRGDIARVLYSLLKSGHFYVTKYKGRDYLNDTDEDGNDIMTDYIALEPIRTFDEEEYGSTQTYVDVFLLNLSKMVGLLRDRTLSREIFNTWIESELSNLDKIPLQVEFPIPSTFELEGDGNADT